MQRILVVEDDTTNLMVISRRLRHAGYVVDEAGNGQQGLDLLQQNNDYVAIVCDRNMPVMDGIKLFETIKNDPKFSAVPFIMQTGETEPEQVAEGIQAGVYYYLTKPFQEETLLTLVRTAIRDRHNREIFQTQLLRQREGLHTLRKGEFAVTTPAEAQNVALLVGGLFPRPELATSGLYELLLNGIEHGNLGIGFKEKAKLLASGTWEEEISSRLNLPENTGKKVTLQVTQDPQRIEVLITDMGSGFVWRPYLEIEPSRATMANGRGVAKANMLCFDTLSYLGNGNQVRIVSTLPG